MRRIMVTLLLCLPAVAGAASQPPAGRWEGSAQIPGRELPLVVDLAQDNAGAWSGSIILTGARHQGRAADEHRRQRQRHRLRHRERARQPARCAGEFQGTPVCRRCASPAKCGRPATSRRSRSAESGRRRSRPPLRSTPVARELASGWSGEFELGGYPRHVTITLENHADAGATAKFVIVGKRTNDLPVDLVVQDGDFVRIESQATQVAFEGRVVKDGGEIRGTIEMGSLELPLVLRRATRSGVMKTALLGCWRPPVSSSLARRTRNRCFAATPRTPAPIAARGRAQFHRVKWKFPTGDRIVSSPVYAERRHLLRRRRRQRLRGGRGRRSSALEAQDRRPGARRRPPIAGDMLYVGSYDGKFYALDARTGATALEIRDRRRAAIRGEGTARLAAEEPDHRRSVRRLPVEPGRRARDRLLRQRRRQCLRARCRLRRSEMEIPDRRRRARVAGVRRRRRVSSAAGTAISTRSTPRPARRNGAFTAARIR